MIKKTNKGTTMDTGDVMAEKITDTLPGIDQEKLVAETKKATDLAKVEKVKIKKPDAKPVGTWYISGNYKRFTNG